MTFEEYYKENLENNKELLKESQKSIYKQIWESALLKGNSYDKRDIKYLDIPNVCFSLTKPDDDREKGYSKQRIERGFDNSELWNLDHTIARFIYPRLLAFIEVYKKTTEDQNDMFKKLDESLIAFEMIKDGACNFNDAEWEKVEKGLKSFSEIFCGLWV